MELRSNFTSITENLNLVSNLSNLEKHNEKLMEFNQIIRNLIFVKTDGLIEDTRPSKLDCTTNALEYVTKIF